MSAERYKPSRSRKSWFHTRITSSVPLLFHLISVLVAICMLLLSSACACGSIDSLMSAGSASSSLLTLCQHSEEVRRNGCVPHQLHLPGQLAGACCQRYLR